MASVSEDYMEEVSCQIISAVGTARSMYINAMGLAREGKIAEAKQMVADGEACFVEGHHAHADLLNRQAEGEQIPFSLMLIHCEDQLMSADCFKIMADEIIALYEKQFAEKS